MQENCSKALKKSSKRKKEADCLLYVDERFLLFTVC
jgi:hypothetical protein